ncbi:sugar ABC transporter permease [Paenibacillus darwinianus]|uniref:Sugar ABC transporter permease n=1 Tax=Paenibacillus darwinianus TaxID=1380763 RepID=A0A9W5W6I4_9BACL|nr:carbohydrate ABC transporter permease [Paenibacillus darwinianus]EXX86762.1 sugar ABC transporter permease [Paenibacillus darwinianus]EXX87074.1 sugar ABC transporter permease [Paenibacillus darwinianus]EXX87288.1 sugar ABC transporter permease [Paenibacillus darwinianus]
MITEAAGASVAKQAAAESRTVSWRKAKKLGAWCFLAVLAVTQLYPLVWLLLYSFKTNSEIMSGQFFALPKTWQWENYTDAFTSGNYLNYIKNSIVVTGLTLLLTIFFSAMVSYAITRFRWRYGNAVLLLFMIGIMIPIQSTLLPLMVIFKNMNILNTHLSIIIPYVAFSIPIAVFILSGFLRSIPHEIEESAMIDGASIYRTFLSIILPITVPPIMTVTILTFISIWNEFIIAATFLSAEGLKTLPFGLNSFIGQYTANYGAIGAFLVLGALPVIIVYFILSEKITKGMVAGAVKG